jgi:hypothetical protein
VSSNPVPTLSRYCIYARASRQHHARVRVLTHIKRLDDCFGDFLERVVCKCGACREIQPQALARLVGWKMTLKELALRMRCSRCGKEGGGGRGGCEAQAARSAEECPLMALLRTHDHIGIKNMCPRAIQTGSCDLERRYKDTLHRTANYRG